MTSETATRRGGAGAAFVLYAVAVALAAAAVVAWLWPGAEWVAAAEHPAFWALATFVLIGELLPIQVPQRRGYDRVTISTAFALAILLLFGVDPALLVYVVASAVADAVARTAFVKALFNAAQYVLSLAAAGAVLSLVGTGAPIGPVAAELPAVLAAAATFFVANHVLAGIGAALLTRSPALRYLWTGWRFQAWTAGFQVALAPIVVASTDQGVVLIPLLVFPMLAIYLGGRQAALNAHRASHDPLTDLPNRAMLSERMDAALVDSDRSAVALMLIDLDGFKAVNDTLGHQSGDRLLQQVARRLGAALRQGDLLARLGGDEFAVLLRSGFKPGDGELVASRIASALAEAFDIGGLSLEVHASVGLSCHPEHAGSAEELLRQADVALYRAKERRSRYEVYAPEHDSASPERLALAGQLRTGLDRGELVVHYQPKLPLSGSGPIGVEALARWNHPQLGLVGPDAFIPLAEQAGLIKDLTTVVLETALHQCRAWRRRGREVRVAVNISSRSLWDRDLAATISALLTRWELPASCLQVELTESQFVDDLGHAKTILDELRAMGVAIAIDDFGTGCSSLAQLRQLPVDEIKIDRSFVMNMSSSRDDAAIVRSTIQLGRSLGLKVTAEGVETEDVCRELSDLGCDFAQGFFLGRPSPAEDCDQDLAAFTAEIEPAGRAFARARAEAAGSSDELASGGLAA